MYPTEAVVIIFLHVTSSTVRKIFKASMPKFLSSTLLSDWSFAPLGKLKNKILLLLHKTKSIYYKTIEIIQANYSQKYTF